MSAQTIPLIYNPDLVSREALVQSFVVREEILEEVLDDLRRTGDTRQHHLFIGQRGMGKSTLLHRIAYAIDDAPALAARWTPLLFPEEQYNVRRVSDILSNTVDALAERLEHLGRDAEASALDDAVQTAPADESARQEHLLAILRDYAAKSGTRMVLLIDNLDDTLERIGDRGEWGLRQVLTGEPWMVLLGASTSAHESTWDHGRAFYDFFHAHELGGLDYEETRRLLARLAEMHQAAQVLEALDKTPAKIRALHRLTGGNPRTLSLLFNVLRRSALSDITQDLTGLLDLCTPLYKHRLESLPASQQRIVDALALHWAPMTAGELATALGDPVNDVSSQLSRLVRDGVVETLALSDTTKAGHQIAERFFNVWYLMRAGRRLRRQLEWLVHFLRDFYEAAELGALVRTEVARGRTGPHTEHVQLLLACADALADKDMQHAVRAEAFALATAIDELQRAPGLVRELFDLDGADRELATEAARIEAVRALRRTVDALEGLPEGVTRERIWDALILLPVESRARALELLSAKDESATVFVQLGETLFKVCAAAYGQSTPVELRRCIERGLIASATDRDGATRHTLLTTDSNLIRCTSLARTMFATSATSAMQEVVNLREATNAEWYAWALIASMHLFYAGKGDRAAAAHALCEARGDLSPDQGLGYFLIAQLAVLEQDPKRIMAMTLSLMADAMIKAWGRRVDLVMFRVVSRAVHDAEIRIDPVLAEDLAFLTRSIPGIEKAHGFSTTVGTPLDSPANIAVMLAVTVNLLLDDSAKEISPAALKLLAIMTASGYAPALRAMLDAHGLAERWRPLSEALDCILRGDTASLSRLPAEIRGVTEELLARLAPELSLTPAAKPRPRKRTRH